MRYLFFDIECCDGINICEFGYVLTDEKFEVLERNYYLINPTAPFNLIGRKHGDDLTLHFPEQWYKNSAKFPHFYEQIKETITAKDQIIVGHAINNDATFIKHACIRYSLEPIDFEFFDSQKMYQEFFNERKQISLGTAGEKFKLEKPKYLHKSDDDAHTTMVLVEAMCEKLEVTLEELIDLCPTCSGRMKNNEITLDSKIIKEQTLSKWISEIQTRESHQDLLLYEWKAKKLLLQFLDGVKPQGEIIQSELTGKTICASINYEASHFVELLSLVQLLVNHGAVYKLKASECDYFMQFKFVMQDGTEAKCTRHGYVMTAVDEGAEIKIITLDELLKMLNITLDDLKSMPFPDQNLFFCKQEKSSTIQKNSDANIAKQQANSQRVVYKDKSNQGYSLGNMLKAQGLDLMQLLIDAESETN